MPKRCVAVTGACGFIGRYVTERLLARGDWVYAVDALTYAADPTLPTLWDSRYVGRVKFVGRDILDLGAWPDIDGIVNLAAETHVDNSLTQSERFIRTNVVGVQHLLELTRARSGYGIPKFVQVSTDEVYGEVLEGETSDDAPILPSSPYAASKAAADCLVQGWGRTFGLPYCIVRPSNCYGNHQYPEKLIPKAVRRLTLGQPVPVHGDGTALRSWLWVEDCADAILTVLDAGKPGTVYNVPGNATMSVVTLVREIIQAFGGTEADIAFGYERLGLDRRYCVADGKLRALGWNPQGNLARDLPELVSRERQLARW